MLMKLTTGVNCFNILRALFCLYFGAKILDEKRAHKNIDEIDSVIWEMVQTQILIQLCEICTKSSQNIFFVK